MLTHTLAIYITYSCGIVMEITGKLDKPNVAFWDRVFLKDICWALLQKHEHQYSEIYRLLKFESRLVGQIKPPLETVLSFLAPIIQFHCLHSEIMKSNPVRQVTEQRTDF